MTKVKSKADKFKMYKTAIVEKCRDTGLYVGYIPRVSGAHSQRKSLDELKENLKK